MLDLPARAGTRPRTTVTNPHQQLDQQPADTSIYVALADRCFSLPNVHEEPSGVSVPGARGLCLDPACRGREPDAFMIGNEFAHLHPRPDVSIHLTLPHDVGAHATDQGWVEMHPMAAAGIISPTAFLAFAPRDTDELEVAWSLICASYEYATSGGDLR